MIKESIEFLIEHGYSNDTLNYVMGNLLQYDEDQLMYMLMNGVLLMEDIYLYKYPNAGFRCMNKNTERYGNKPICNVIENKLNEKLKTYYI